MKFDIRVSFETMSRIFKFY